MPDDLISTAEAAALLGKTVATINRWAIEGRITPALQLPGETGARLYRRGDVEKIAADGGTPVPEDAA